jgi:hypothetical protein
MRWLSAVTSCLPIWNRGSSRTVTLYGPVSAWYCTQFSAGGRPASRTWFSARQNRMQSPIM